MVGFSYTPIRTTSRAVTNLDSPYLLVPGVVTQYDGSTAGLTLQFPPTPAPNDFVGIKNVSRLGSVTLDPNGADVEVPATADTDFFLNTPFVVTTPKAAYRWVYGNGVWILDYDYSVDEAKATAEIQTASTYTLSKNNEIVLADTTVGPMTVTVPSGWSEDSKFTVLKTDESTNAVTIDAADPGETFGRIRSTGSPASASILFAQGEYVTYIKDGTVWHPYRANTEPYVEIWELPVNSAVPLVAGPMPLTFGLGSGGVTSSILFDDPPVGNVLTASINFACVVDIQANFWFDLGSNNTLLQAYLEMASDTGTQLTNRVWSHGASPRSEWLPSSVTGTGLFDLVAGNTFQVNGLHQVPTGSGAAQIGRSVAGDTYGGLVSFEVG